MFRKVSRFSITLILMVIYVLAEVLLGGIGGGAGHGRGIGAFLFITLPAGFVGFLVADLTGYEGLLVPVSFLAGLIQYGLVGYLLDRLRWKYLK